MSERRELARNVIGDVHASFEDFASKRSEHDPAFRTRMEQESAWVVWLLRIFTFLPANAFRPVGKKYIFLTARHDDLVSKFSPEEAVVIGGRLKDLGLAWKLRMRFLFSGDLYTASSAILFGRKLVPARLVIERWADWFSRQQDPCYLVVPNDTLPISLLLAMIAKRCRNVRVVCVQHGLFNSIYKDDDIDGRNSEINLVYCEAQRKEMERRLPGALAEVMGFPADIPPSHIALPTEPTVILVGTGTLEDLEDYERSLEIFAEVQARLREIGCVVRYRPHPSERKLLYASERFSVESEDKRSLLSGERKVFVGFNSTLLYEASIAGHLAIILDDKDLPGYSISDFGVRVPSAELGQLAAILARNRIRTGVNQATDMGVRLRFEHALARAMQRARASCSG